MAENDDKVVGQEKLFVVYPPLEMAEAKIKQALLKYKISVEKFALNIEEEKEKVRL